MEGLFELYLNKLREDSPPGATLAKFYCELFGLSMSVEYIKMFNKLNKEFGRFVVFNAISDIFSSEATINHTYIYGLIKYVCKKILLKEESAIPVKLSTVEISKKIQEARNRNLKVRSPFND